MNTTFKKSLAVFVAVSLTACAGASYRPVIDSQGVSNQAYEADLAQCQRYATQVASGPDRAAFGAVAGALIGLAFAALAKDKAYNGLYAGVGAASGASGGAVAGESEQRNIIKSCMANRGYRVLN